MTRKDDDMARDPGRPAGDDPLDELFAAARRETPPDPGVDLLNRILADAAEVAQARVISDATPTLPAARPRASPLAALQRLLAPLGGWPAAAALGFCAAVGLTTGFTGALDQGQDMLWQSAATADEPADTILAFYDLENPER